MIKPLRKQLNVTTDPGWLPILGSCQSWVVADLEALPILGCSRPWIASDLGWPRISVALPISSDHWHCSPMTANLLETLILIVTWVTADLEEMPILGWERSIRVYYTLKLCSIVGWYGKEIICIPHTKHTY